MLRYRIVAPERLTVIHNGVDSSCTPTPDSASDTALERLLPADFSSSIWMLNVGSTVPRKRIDVLLRVLAAVRREISGVRLLRVGGDFTPQQLQLARALNVENAVTVLPYLSRPVLAAAYRRSDLLLHTSEAEGFGLPLAEALACGCPVVASDISVLREVGGEACVFSAVGDVDAWKTSVVELLHEKAASDKDWRVRKNRGIEHAARFSWAENARRTAVVYNSVLQQAAIS